MSHRHVIKIWTEEEPRQEAVLVMKGKGFVRALKKRRFQRRLVSIVLRQLEGNAVHLEASFGCLDCPFEEPVGNILMGEADIKIVREKKGFSEEPSGDRELAEYIANGFLYFVKEAVREAWVEAKLAVVLGFLLAALAE